MNLNRVRSVWDETNDCADCAYSGDFHFVKGECQRRDNNPELLKGCDEE